MMLNSDTRENRCLIWPEHPAKVFKEYVQDSPRSGGSYTLDSETWERLWWGGENLEERHRPKITTWLVEQRRLGNTSPTITRAVIDATKTARPLSVHERADRLLRLLADETTTIGQSVTLGEAATEDEPSMFRETPVILESGRTSWLSMAHSESTEPQEIYFLLDYLNRMGWIEGDTPQPNGLGDFIVSVRGYERIAEQELNPSSDQVFVAMWFDPSMIEAVEKGIRPAILNTGYRPLLINEKPEVDKIDDEIIGEIRRSRFLVADFTHGDKGARGGVYYEAGFALGIGLTVIRSCRKDVIDRNELHFDVRQHYHIVWETADELRFGLEARIRALLPDGPHHENILPRNAS